jgi:hypothetical protein
VTVEFTGDTATSTIEFMVSFDDGLQTRHIMAPHNSYKPTVKQRL